MCSTDNVHATPSGEVAKSGDGCHPVILTIAGSDPCCGAGLQADVRVACALGCYATCVVTAITSQNTNGVYGVWPLSAFQVAEQGRVLTDDIVPLAIKVGMLGNEEVAVEVEKIIDAVKCDNVVVDTILKSTSGESLFDWSGGGVFERILRKARVITPNLPEAEALLAADGVWKGADTDDMAGLLSRRFGGVSVYLKGGHGGGETLTDLFYNGESQTLTRLVGQRVDTRNTHGTGCCLSTSLASFLAKGFPLDEAAHRAHDFTHRALVSGSGFRLGSGHGPTFGVL